MHWEDIAPNQQHNWLHGQQNQEKDDEDKRESTPTQHYHPPPTPTPLLVIMESEDYLPFKKFPLGYVLL